jgi:hypothetical protein
MEDQEIFLLAWRWHEVQLMLNTSSPRLRRLSLSMSEALYNTYLSGAFEPMSSNGLICGFTDWQN